MNFQRCLDDVGVIFQSLDSSEVNADRVTEFQFCPGKCVALGKKILAMVVSWHQGCSEEMVKVNSTRVDDGEGK